MLLVSVAGANAAGAPAAAVPLLPAELSTLVTAAIRNHPAARSAQAKRRAALQDVAAMNPCPCGYLGHPSIACTDTRTQVARYQGKISGPLLDRIDLHVSVVSVPYQSL
jgi:magnesium chelatase family protein